MVANLSGKEVTIPKGTKIGQLIIFIVLQPNFKTAEEFTELEERGTNWAGSSDKKG